MAHTYSWFTTEAASAAFSGLSLHSPLDQDSRHTVICFLIYFQLQPISVHSMGSDRHVSTDWNGKHLVVKQKHSMHTILLV